MFSRKVLALSAVAVSLLVLTGCVPGNPVVSNQRSYEQAKEVVVDSSPANRGYEDFPAVSDGESITATEGNESDTLNYYGEVYIAQLPFVSRVHAFSNFPSSTTPPIFNVYVSDLPDSKVSGYLLDVVSTLGNLYGDLEFATPKEWCVTLGTDEGYDREIVVDENQVATDGDVRRAFTAVDLSQLDITGATHTGNKLCFDPSQTDNVKVG